MAQLPKSTIIISVYKDTQSLDLILESLSKQTILPDEVIISEDGNDDAMKKFCNVAVEKYDNLNIKHLSQDDIGWRKNRALNNAIRNASNEYLIFIDGDCIPYLNFIEWHVKLAQSNRALCGRRTEPGEEYSQKLKNRELSIEEFMTNYIKLYFKLKNDEIRHYDDGIFIAPNSLIGKLINSSRDKKTHLVGCNFSCFKKDMEKINGFDEDFTLPTNGEDSDIERRLGYLNIKMKSCRNHANMIHLYHKKVFNDEISKETKELMDSKDDIYFCTNGIKKV